MERKMTLELDLGWSPNSTTHKFFDFVAENAYIFWASFFVLSAWEWFNFLSGLACSAGPMRVGAKNAGNKKRHCL